MSKFKLSKNQEFQLLNRVDQYISLLYSFSLEVNIDNLKQSIELNIPLNNLIIDGIGWEKKFTGYNVKSIVKGDATYLSIAAASIIAKEYHDDYIKQLCQNNPELNEKYDLVNNMGYGTKKHLEDLELPYPDLSKFQVYQKA